MLDFNASNELSNNCKSDLNESNFYNINRNISTYSNQKSDLNESNYLSNSNRNLSEYEHPKNIFYYVFKEELNDLLCEFLVNIISLENFFECEINEELYFNIFKINYIQYLKEYNEKINKKLVEYSQHFLHQENNNCDLFNNSSEININIISHNSISDYNNKIINERTHFIQSYDTFIDNDEEIKSLNFLFENNEDNENRNNNNNDLSFKNSLWNTSLFTNLNATRQINSDSIKNVFNKDNIKKKVQKIIKYLSDINKDENYGLNVINEDIEDDFFRDK